MNKYKIVRPAAYSLLGLCMLFAIPAGAQTLTQIPAIKISRMMGTGSGPSGLATDGGGNVYIADRLQHVVQKMDPAGVLTVVAGRPGFADQSGDGGPAGDAYLSGPRDVAVDAAGNVYIADSGNHAIRVVNTQTSGNIVVFGVTIAPGNIGTVAGTLTVSTYTPTTLHTPYGMAFDAAGNMYIADTFNNAVRKVDAGGTMTTVAGQGQLSMGSSGDGGPAASAQLNRPTSVEVDARGNVYIADAGNFRIRVINTQASSITLFTVPIASGTIQTVAGTTSGNSGNGGVANLAQLGGADGLVVDSAGDLYIVIAANNTVRFVNALTGIIRNFAGSASGVAGATGNGGPATDALLSSPMGLSLDPAGSLYIADLVNEQLRKVSTGAGFPRTPVGVTALSEVPIIIQFSTSGETLAAPTIPLSSGGVADFTAGATVCNNNLAGTLCSIMVSFQPKYPGLRQVPLQLHANVSGLNYAVGLSGVGLGPQGVMLPGTITTIASGLANPAGIAADAAGNIFVSEAHAVRKIDSGGVTSNFAGTGSSGLTGDGGPATSAALSDPNGLAVDAAGNVYIADTGNDRIRKVDVRGNITTFAGGGILTTDGILATNAQILDPTGVAVDATDSVYISTSAGIIRKVLGSTGVITTLVDTGLANPTRLAIDTSGNLYISDYTAGFIKKVDLLGRVTTVAGGGASVAEGAPALTASLANPADAVADAAGNLYISEFAHHTIRKVDAATGNISTVAGNFASGLSGDNGPASSAMLAGPHGVAIDSLGNLYIADHTNGDVRKVTATAAAQEFPVTTVNTTSAARNVTISNIGNQQFSLTNLMVSPQFGSAVSTTCTSSSVVNPGGSCLMALTFAPTSNGTKTGNATITGDTLNVPGTPQTAALTGTTAVTTSTTIVYPVGVVAYGSSVTFTSTTVIDSTTTPVTLGTVTFLNTTTSEVFATNVPLDGSGHASVTIGLVAGSHAVGAVYNPDSTHVGSAGSIPISIVKKALTLTANPQSRAYGAANPPLTGTVSGFVNNDNNGANTDLQVTTGVPVSIGGDVTGAPSITTTATAGTSRTPPPAITAAAGTLASANYSFNVVPGTLTITPVPLSVVVDAKTKVYGAALPALTGVVTGLVGGDTAGTTVVVSYATTGTANSAVSATYPITATVSGTASGNYTLTNTPAALTVTAAPLSVVVQNKTKAYGEAVPALTGTVTGLAGGDTEGTTILVSYSTTGTPTSPVASTYPITAAVSGTALGNYTLTNTAGTLTVTMGNQTISFAPLERRTPTEAAFAVSATGGGSSSPVMFASATPPVCTVEGNMVTLAGSGTCTIGASQSGDANYNAALSVSQSFIVACNLTGAGSAPCSTTSTGYSFEDGGGTAFTTVGKGGGTAVGYGIVDPDGTTAAPAALAIFGYTANGVLVTEAGVPAMEPVLSGRMYAEFDGPVNTGVAFANPNSGAATIAFYFTDQAGAASGEGSFVLEGGDHISRFLDQPPFNKAGPFSGTLTFTASVPVGVISLRAFTNERSDFTVTTQTIAPTVPDASGLLVMAQYADGGGWKTQVLLVNSSEQAISGTVQFFNEGSGSTGAEPIVLTINGAPRGFVEYTIPARASVKMETGNTGAAVQIGSVRVTPQAGSSAPSGFTLFQFANNGVTAALASVPGQQAGTEYRTYVESRGVSGAPGSIRSGVAIANVSGSPAVVDLELTPLGGGTAFTGTVTVPANGHIAKLIDELLPAAPLSLRGVLKISSGSSPIVVTGLRTRYNERSDFLITTTPAINEATPPSSAALVFPHIVNISGYTMEFILFSGSQAGEGAVLFFDETGAPMTMADQ